MQGELAVFGRLTEAIDDGAAPDFNSSPPLPEGMFYHQALVRILGENRGVRCIPRAVGR